MERKKASDFDPQLLGLFHRYVHGGDEVFTNFPSAALGSTYWQFGYRS
jgi:hypothetical protein